jgi:hypothetical protein
VTEGKGSLNPHLMAGRKGSFISTDGSTERTEADHGPHTPLDILLALETSHPQPTSSFSPGDEKRDDHCHTLWPGVYGQRQSKLSSIILLFVYKI